MQVGDLPSVATVCKHLNKDLSNGARACDFSFESESLHGLHCAPMGGAAGLMDIMMSGQPWEHQGFHDIKEPWEHEGFHDFKESWEHEGFHDDTRELWDREGFHDDIREFWGHEGFHADRPTLRTLGQCAALGLS